MTSQDEIVMATRGIRGATTVEEDSEEMILEATHELLLAIIAENPSMKEEDIASIFFTMTHDLKGTFPAEAARALGWVQVPLLCAVEIDVPGRLKRCIRVLMHWNTTLSQQEVTHVYLREAASLRPDINGRRHSKIQTVEGK